MNRAVWVVSLNTIMQIDAVGDAFLLPQGAFDKITPPIYERHVRAFFATRMCIRLVSGCAAGFAPNGVSCAMLRTGLIARRYAILGKQAAS